MANRARKGVQVLDEVRGAPELERDDLEFLHAGAEARGAFQCADCGYGIAVQSILPQCPMCAGTSWERVVRGDLWRTSPSLD